MAARFTLPAQPSLPDDVTPAEVAEALMPAIDQLSPRPWYLFEDTAYAADRVFAAHAYYAGEPTYSARRLMRRVNNWDGTTNANTMSGIGLVELYALIRNLQIRSQIPVGHQGEFSWTMGNAADGTSAIQCANLGRAIASGLTVKAATYVLQVGHWVYDGIEYGYDV